MASPALTPARKLLKRWHPEGIPLVGTLLYNRVSATRIFQRHYEFVAGDALRYCPAGTILDIGTGPGWLLIKLCDMARGVRGIGLDISPSMVAKAHGNIARAGYSNTLSVTLGTANHLPFPDASFDAVVSTGSVHHWKDPAAGFNEMYRVLRPGGHALIYDLVSDTPISVLRDAAREFGKIKMLLCWLHALEEPFYSQSAFEELARATRFTVARTRYVGVMSCLVLPKCTKGR